MRRDARNLPVKIFLSHSSKDARAVIPLGRKLQQRGYTAWWYEDELPWGDPIRQTVETHIRECDFFILCHSASAAASNWVREELDLALSLEGDEACEIRVFKLDTTALAPIRRRSWARGQEYEPNAPHDQAVYRVEAARCFEPRNDSLKNWLGGFAPDFDYYGYQGKGGDDIPATFFIMYEDMFPEEERQPEEDTRQWIDESREEKGVACRDLIVTLSIARKPVSFIYVTPYMTTGFVFGSYFGVQRKHRSKNYARLLYEEAAQQLNRMYAASFKEGRKLDRQTFANDFWRNAVGLRKHQSRTWASKAHGYLFEVESIPAEDVERACAKIEGLALPRDPNLLTDTQRETIRNAFSEDELELMRAVKRIRIYEANSCRGFVDAAGNPLPYVQPVLEAPIDRAREVPMALMYAPINTPCEAFAKRFRYADVLRGFYLDLYADANGRGSLEIPDYMPYLEQDLLPRVQKAAPEHFKLSSLMHLPAKKLHALDRRYGISGAL